MIIGNIITVHTDVTLNVILVFQIFSEKGTQTWFSVSKKKKKKKNISLIEQNGFATSR